MFCVIDVRHQLREREFLRQFNFIFFFYDSDRFPKVTIGCLNEFYSQIDSGMLDKFLKKLRAPKYDELVSLHERYLASHNTYKRTAVLYDDNVRRAFVFEELCDRDVVNFCCCSSTFDSDWSQYKSSYGDDSESAMTSIHTLHCIVFVYRKYFHVWVLRAGSVCAFFLSVLIFSSEIFIWSNSMLNLDLNPISWLMRCVRARIRMRGFYDVMNALSCTGGPTVGRAFIGSGKKRCCWCSCVTLDGVCFTDCSK
jgi:hypothetical protein